MEKNKYGIGKGWAWYGEFSGIKGKSLASYVEAEKRFLQDPQNNEKLKAIRVAIVPMTEYKRLVSVNIKKGKSK